MNICLDTIYKYAKFSECVKFLIHWFQKTVIVLKAFTLKKVHSIQDIYLKCLFMRLWKFSRDSDGIKEFCLLPGFQLSSSAPVSLSCLLTLPDDVGL